MRSTLALLMLSAGLTGAAAAQPNDLLAGPVERPRLSPSDPDLVAFERQTRDAHELYLYHRRTGAVLPVRAPAEGAAAPAPAPFLDLFEAQNLDDFSRYEGQLAWRPRLDTRGRQWFAFVGGGPAGFDLYLAHVDAEGRPAAPLRLPFDGVEQFPQWSPDGQTLAFVSGDEGGSDLYLLPAVTEIMARGEASGAAPLRLTANADLEAYPAWSPDGEYLAYQTQTARSGRQNWSLSAVRPADLADGSIARPIPLTEELEDFDEFKPSWGPDGQHLAFYLSQARVGAGGDNLQQDVAVLGVVRSSEAGRIVRGRILQGAAPRLATNVVPHADRGPSWLPEPEALLVVYVKRDAAAGFPIYVADLRRWQQRQPGFEQPFSTGFGTAYHRDPVLAPLPAGVRVAFVSQEGGTNRLQLFDRAGTSAEVRTVTVPMERSRGAALARSLVLPGLGQFYKGQPTRGLLFLAAEALAVGGAVYFATQADGGELPALEAAYRASVARPDGCPGGVGVPCRNDAFAAWQNAYDTAQSNRTRAVAAVGVAAGVWLFNLIDSSRGFPRTVDRPVRVAGTLSVRPPQPTLTLHDGAPHLGLRLRLDF